ncbi:MAG: flavodoxin domain-containing protein [Methanomassiliicoccaceae archaeon]|nr:flavodoxin domain-containing protein [Methanomassiliicoccaceae archaeon]
MKILIAYSTKGGASRECAELLASEIGNCTICDLDGSSPNVADFDIIVAGTGIRMGGAYKPFKRFVEENADILVAKSVAFFLCCKQIDSFEKFAAKSIPEKLRGAAFRMSPFSGKPPLGGKKDGSWMIRDEVIAFAKAVKEKN